MSQELLKDKIRDELKKRLSKVENKQFVLLYKASRDGCSVEDFQKTCLDKGPTLTVLYGQNKTVFGGYTSKPWISTEKKVLIRDPEAFLFYRILNESTHFLEIEECYFDRAITCYSGYGPTFGGGKVSGYDLQVFRNKNRIHKKGNIFELNGKTNFNCIYKSKQQGFSEKYINDGGLIVTDMEVYEVQGSDLFKDTKEECKTRISTLCSNKHVKSYNILLAGIVCAGKTSYCRTLDIACTGKIQNVVGPIANQGTSVTNKIVKYILTQLGTCQIRLFDIRGYVDGKNYEHELKALLEGRLEDDFQFADTPEELNGNSLEIDEINPDRIVHALCIVINATQFEIQSPQTMAHYQRIIKTAHNRSIQISIIATKMDELCMFVKEKPANIKKSVRAQEMMEKISGTFGVGLKDVFPIINYTNETEHEEVKSMLALRALAKMVEDANAYVTQNMGRLKIQYIKTRMDIVADMGLNILCVGRVNVGKSFFIDSVLSTLKKRRLSKASGGAKRNAQRDPWMSLAPHTEQLHRHPLVITDARGSSNETNVHFLDMPGFNKKNVIDSEQIEAIVEGHCPEKEFNLLDRIDPSQDRYKHNPEWRNRVHVVCFILDDESLNRPIEEKEMIKKVISEILTPKGIPYIVVVTKQDRLDCGRDDIIEMTAKKFGLISGKIHAVKNYVDEKQTLKEVDLPIIGCVEAIMEEGCEYYSSQWTNKE